MGGLSGQLLYFAYGADISREDFVYRLPGADWLGLAILEGHRLVIDARGVASVRVEKGATVWGVLWFVPADELPSLDKFNGASGGGGERTTKRIVSPAGPRIEAMMYVSLLNGSAGVSAEGYLAGIIKGAVENRFPAEYLQELKAWAKLKN